MGGTTAAPHGETKGRDSNSKRSALPGLRGLAGGGHTSTGGTGDVLLSAREEATKGDVEIEALYASAEQQRLAEQGDGKARSVLTNVLDISGVLTDGAAAMVDDSFNKCFTSARPDPWNWNLYLFTCWIVGVVVRNAILFPLRVFLLFFSFGTLVATFLLVDAVMPNSHRKAKWKKGLVQAMCSVWMASWHAVVKYHGPKPMPGPNRVWVSNHTSMIDYVVLCSYSPFAVIMQLHNGWIQLLQTKILSSVGCLWFNRTEVNDRHIVAERMKAHVSKPDAIPLLIFPEGTCVNNEYTVMFKRGAFDLGATVCPIAIKYNKIFVDAFWNSRRQSFTRHLLKLFTSWALVCDVYFLEPQTQQPGESSQEFAGRVQAMIAKYANLRVVPWDGYLKYYNLGAKNPGLIEKRRKVFADVLRQHLPNGGSSTDEQVAEKEQKGNDGGLAAVLADGRIITHIGDGPEALAEEQQLGGAGAAGAGADSKKVQ